MQAVFTMYAYNAFVLCTYTMHTLRARYAYYASTVVILCIHITMRTEHAAIRGAQALCDKLQTNHAAMAEQHWRFGCRVFLDLALCVRACARTMARVYAPMSCIQTIYTVHAYMHTS